MTASQPRLHKDLDPRSYDLPEIASNPAAYWDMRYDPRDRNNKWNASRFICHFNYFRGFTTAVLPRCQRMCIMFYFDVRYKVTVYWTFDVVHQGPPSVRDGNAITCDDVINAIYDGLQETLDKGQEIYLMLRCRQKALEAREERCSLFKLDTATEPLRKIDFVKAMCGGVAFAGLDGYKRHLSTPRVVVRPIEVKQIYD